jgi:hypothetical protein
LSNSIVAPSLEIEISTASADRKQAQDVAKKNPFMLPEARSAHAAAVPL